MSDSSPLGSPHNTKDPKKNTSSSNGPSASQPSESKDSKQDSSMRSATITKPEDQQPQQHQQHPPSQTQLTHNSHPKRAKSTDKLASGNSPLTTPSIQENTPNSNSSSGVFKVPKKILVSDNKELSLRLNSISGTANANGTTQPSEPIIQTTTNTPQPINDTSDLAQAPPSITTPSITPAQTGNTPANPPTRLNKTTISDLNKSLKAKQKIINFKEPHPKNTTLISEIINTSPQSSVFPNNISKELESEKPPQNSNNANTNPSIVGSSNAPTHQLSSVNLSLLNTPNGTGNPSQITTPSSNIENINDLNTSTKETAPSNRKQKRIAKQSSTRTDFFAAKLASAVDDIESSDSDETFVYENNNLNDIDTVSNAANVADNSSVHGSVMGSLAPANNPLLPGPGSTVGSTAGPLINSPLADGISSHDHSVVNSPNLHPTESIYSHSSKHHKKPPSLANSFNSNHFLDNVMANERDKKINHQKSFSSYAPEEKGQVSDTRSLSHQNQPYNNQILANYQNRPRSQRTHSINDGYDDHYSYDEIDDEDEIDDDISTDGEYYGQRLASPNTTVQQLKDGHLSSNGSIIGQGPAAEEGQQTDPNNQRTSSIASKGTSKKYKSSTSSSKLRSTTSKLFDKKGSQPRRYSIIPDDIDIEDFDDELIYYDNNIRFPYSNSNNNPSTNESTGLLNSHPRLPHYRSLNLNYANMKNPNGLKAKRYLSTGGALPNSNENGSPRPSPGEAEFAAPGYSFQEPQPHGYYYDFDEYDEEFPNEHQLSNKNSRQFGGNGRYSHPRLSHSNNAFFLPRKSSDEAFGRTNSNFIKSFIYTLLSILVILTVGFIMGFVLATTKELSNVSIVSIDNPVVSIDELLFDITVEALNPGWFTVEIEEAELDIFAKSGYLPDRTENQLLAYESKGVENILLGTVFKLESAMSFQGGFFNRDVTDQSAEIKLLTPGKNLTNLLNYHLQDDDEEPDNSKKWEIISKNPFDLIVRGVLKYTLPMSSAVKSVAVNKVGYIDPNAVNGATITFVDITSE